MAAKKTEIQKWLDSKSRDYQAGVKLYSEHPSAMRGLVNTLQRKQNKFTEEKLVYVLEKAAAQDASGKAGAIKKKGRPSTKKSAPKKRRASRAKAKPKAKSAAKPKSTPKKGKPKPQAKKQGEPVTKPSTEKTSTSKGQSSPTASPTSTTKTT